MYTCPVFALRRAKKLADGLAIEKLSQLGVISKETAYPHQLSESKY